MSICVTLGAGSAAPRPRPMWTPSQLFRAGFSGAWYDPFDVRTLYQDAAGTVPVTASGQPVGLIQDKSGNGRHMAQTLAAARPTYRRETGHAWLEFDGVDDRMQLVSAIDLNSGTLLLALRETAGATTNVAVLSPQVGGYIALTGSGATRSLGKNNGPTIPAINTPASFPMTEAQPAAIRVAGGQLFASRPNRTTECSNATLGAANLSGPLVFGAFSTRGELPFRGRLSAMVLLTTQPTATAVQMAYRYLATRMS